MRSPAPVFPYACPAGMISLLFSLRVTTFKETHSTHMPHSPFSHPLITRPSPKVTGKILFLSRDESNFFPLEYR